MSRYLNRDQLALVTRVHDVRQLRDNRFRLDIWIDNRAGAGEAVSSILTEELPARWHTRRHQPYHQLRARLEGPRFLVRSNNQSPGLTVASWNIRSFRPKQASVLWLARSNNVSVLALQETHCKVDSWAPKLAGYTVFSVPVGPNRGQPGLALAVKQSITATMLDTSSNWQICELRLAQCRWVIANVYFPSGTDRHPVIRDFEAALGRLSRQIASARLIILGDFNREPEIIDQLCWRWPATVARLPTRGSSGTFHGFRPQLEPTSIDHILMGPMPQTAPRVSVLRGWSDSDHWPILARFPVALGEFPRPVPKTVCSRTMSEASKSKFLSDNQWEILADQFEEGGSVNVAASAFIGTFENLGKLNGGLREQGGPDERRLCMPHKCRNALRRRTQLLNGYLATGSEADRLAFEQGRVEAKAALSENKKEAWALHLEELRHAVGTRDSKQAWRWMNKFLKPRIQTGSVLPAIFDDVGVLQTSTEGKATAWLEYYRKLFADPTGHSRVATWWEQYRREGPVDVQILDPLETPLNSAELMPFLARLVNGKAPGLDKIPPEWFKWLLLEPTADDYLPPDGYPNHASRAFASLLSLISESGEIPECWQHAEIVSIHKSGDNQRAENYRGIALIPVGLKILCSLVIDRFNRTLTDRNLLRREQAGFRSREECVYWKLRPVDEHWGNRPTWPL